MRVAVKELLTSRVSCALLRKGTVLVVLERGTTAENGPRVVELPVPDCYHPFAA